jgi:hypothetical protein
MLGEMVHACNLSTQETEAGGPHVQESTIHSKTLSLKEKVLEPSLYCVLFFFL